MKTILKIFVILLIASVVAGSLTIIVNNTTLLSSGAGGSGNHFPAITGTDGQTMQRPMRTDGENGGGESASIGQGLFKVLVTLVKLVGITLVVLLIEKGFHLLQKRLPRPVT